MSSVYLKNRSARIITVRLPGDTPENSQEFQINPGDHPAVEVPKEALDVDFVKALIDSGELQKVEAPKDDAAKNQAVQPNRSNQPVQAPSPDDEATLKDLRDEAKDLGVEVDNRWGEKRLRDEIEDKKKGK